MNYLNQPVENRIAVEPLNIGLRERIDCIAKNTEELKGMSAGIKATLYGTEPSDLQREEYHPENIEDMLTMIQTRIGETLDILRLIYNRL